MCEVCVVVENVVVKFEVFFVMFLKSMEEYFELAFREGLFFRERRLGAIFSTTANNV